MELNAKLETNKRPHSFLSHYFSLFKQTGRRLSANQKTFFTYKTVVSGHHPLQVQPSVYIYIYLGRNTEEDARKPVLGCVCLWGRENQFGIERWNGKTTLKLKASVRNLLILWSEMTKKSCSVSNFSY